MLEIISQREPSRGEATLSKLSIDGAFICDILEDVVREKKGFSVFQWKIKGVTAIPAGRYEVYLIDSPNFGPNTLALRNVPGYEDIRIHGGNTAVDTLGCLLTGTRNSANTVASSQIALKKLKSILWPHFANAEKVFITILPAK